MKKETPTKKPPKPAKLLRKQWTEKTFTKKLVKHIAKPADKNFFKSCFTPASSSGKQVLKEGLGYADLKRLNALAKSIKGNRGWIKPRSILMVTALAVGGSAFGLVAMNPILDNILENTLESIFEAKADIGGFRLNPMAMSVQVSSIQIADRDSPMTNLFDAGITRLKLNPDAILKGRVHIEHVQIEAIAFGTARKTSGALPHNARKDRNEPSWGQKMSIPPLIDFANFDPMALIEEEKNKLATTAAWETAKTAAESAFTRWPNQTAATQENVTVFVASAERLRAVDINKIQSIEELRSLVKDAEVSIKSGTKIAEDVKTMRTNLASDIAQIKKMEKQAREAIDKDYRYLATFINLKSGSAMERFEPVLRNLLTGTGAKYYNSAERTIELLDRLTVLYSPANSKMVKAAGSLHTNKRPGKEPKEYRGHNIQFGAAEYPFFRLDLLSTSFRLDNTDWSIQLANISSSPTTTGAPSTIKIEQKRGDEKMQAEARINTSKSQDLLFDGEAHIENKPLDFENAFQEAGITALSGFLHGSVNIKAYRSGTFNLTMPLALRNTKIESTDNSFANIVVDAIKDVGTINISLLFSNTQPEGEQFKAASNIDDIVARGVHKLADTYANKAKKELESALKEWVVKEFGDGISTSDLDSLQGLLKKEEASLAKARSYVDAKKKEIEAAISAKATGAVKDVIEKNVNGDTLKKLKIPGL